MNKLYFVFLLIATLLLLLDSFVGVEARRGQRLAVKLLPFGLFFWVLVALIQAGRVAF